MLLPTAFFFTQGQVDGLIEVFFNKGDDGEIHAVGGETPLSGMKWRLVSQGCS